MKNSFTCHEGGRTGAAGAQRAFTLMEVLVAMGLMSLIVFVLMSVFSSTQNAFRAGVTQTDVLAGGRNAMDEITADIRGLTASGGFSNAAVNVFCTNCTFMAMTLPASAEARTNVLQAVYFLSKQNTTWIGTGYVVPPCYGNTYNNLLFPLFRYYNTATLEQGPGVLFNVFSNAVLNNNSLLTNSLYWSHVMDGVVHLVVRGYDATGIWITNGYGYYTRGYGQMPVVLNTACNFPQYGEVGFTMYSNNLPTAMDVQLGVLEDTALRRLQAMVNVSAVTYSNYLATNSAGKMQLFRQRVTVPNCDPSAYQ